MTAQQTASMPLPRVSFSPATCLKTSFARSRMPRVSCSESEILLMVAEA